MLVVLLTQASSVKPDHGFTRTFNLPKQRVPSATELTTA